jgi:NADPH:quinone reductase-like Zn-dependent oxidoreductase
MFRKIVLVALIVVAALVTYLLVKPISLPYHGNGERTRGIVYHQYGPAGVLHLESIEKSVPSATQVLIRVHAASVNPLDWHIIRGVPYVLRMQAGLRKPDDPRIGADMAGVVEAVGGAVTRFKAGDEVFGVAEDGAFAEYAVAAENKLALKPANITFEQAAAVPVAAITALQALRDKGQIRAGQKVLINGASGGVGTFAVQIAKSFGAEVTGVCSTRNLELVRSIGADHVIDYTKEDFTLGTQHYDLILDTVGNRSLSAVRRVMSPKAIDIGIGGGGPNEGPWIGGFMGPIKGLMYSPFVSQRFIFFVSSDNSEDLAILGQMMEQKKVTPVIDRAYKLDELPAAISYLELGHARGKVVISVD